MAKRSFMVAGVTHVDLAWKWGAEEMTEMLEVVAVRLLDALAADPTFKYTLEQAAHYRVLARTRPDLVRRLGEHVRTGRLEMAGCMASTLDTNVPSGESYVRNQLLGIGWVRRNWGVEPRSGWLMDTFGINAQVPQILKQFGLRHLTASRFGGDKQHDAFVARGLDGSEITVIGRDVYSAHVRSRHSVIDCYRSWADIDRLFKDADALEGDGPFLVQPLTENELTLSLRPYREANHRNATRAGEQWTIGTYAEFFEAFDRSHPKLPIEHGDLNPEFTGCFSLRPTIRLRNRRSEGLLIEAEKWACLTQQEPSDELTDAWWEMAFAQFHDVFTGSHPTHVYDGLIARFDEVDAVAHRSLTATAHAVLPRDGAGTRSGGTSQSTLALFNGLPWRRTSPVEVRNVEATDQIASITDARGKTVRFEVRGTSLFVSPSIAPTAMGALLVQREVSAIAAPAALPVSQTTLENEFLRVDIDSAEGLRRIVWKPTGRTLIEGAGGLLVAQRDDGNFQIESPAGPEVSAASGDMSLARWSVDGVAGRAELKGSFPALSWAGAGARLDWTIALSLPPGQPSLGVDVSFDWKGEGTRIRLRVPTTIDSSGATYEVPFGTVVRHPYGVRSTARGEWPAQRFVALQDATHGVALANDGAPGVEVIGGAIVTSLLRAPKSVYAGMVPDETSSGHGRHRFRFEVVPFEGPWHSSAVLQVAQELNAPVHAEWLDGDRRQAGLPSVLELGPSTVVLSTVKRPEDGALGEVIVRVYESAGIATRVSLRMADARSARRSDLAESAGEFVAVADGSMSFDIKPFEIVTLRVGLARSRAA